MKWRKEDFFEKRSPEHWKGTLETLKMGGKCDRTGKRVVLSRIAIGNPIRNVE